MLRHTLLECAVGFVLKHAETWQFSCWPVPLVEGCKIEALMLRERLIRDDFGSEVEVLLFTLTLLGLEL